MELTCNRCHQTIETDDRYCPACGLPQLVYEGEGEAGESQTERRDGPVRDASMVDWKPALRAALLLAVPAGLLSSGLSPLGFFGLVWMAAAAAWAVTIYVRGQRPAWITLGAGMRIGLVTGILAGWLAFSISGGTLFVERFVLHHASEIDTEWKNRVEASQQLTQQWTSSMAGADAAQAEAARKQVFQFMLSPEGHAGIEAFGFAANSLFLLFFAAGGGALGARMMARSRRPEV